MYEDVPVVLLTVIFDMLCKVVLVSKSPHETQVCVLWYAGEIWLGQYFHVVPFRLSCTRSIYRWYASGCTWKVVLTFYRVQCMYTAVSFWVKHYCLKESCCTVLLWLELFYTNLYVHVHVCMYYVVQPGHFFFNL